MIIKFPNQVKGKELYELKATNLKILRKESEARVYNSYINRHKKDKQSS